MFARIRPDVWLTLHVVYPTERDYSQKKRTFLRMMFPFHFCHSGHVSHSSDTWERDIEWWWCSQLMEELLLTWSDRQKLSLLTEREGQGENKDFSFEDTNNSQRWNSWLRWSWRKVLWSLTIPASISSRGLFPSTQHLLAMLQVRSHFPEHGPFYGDPGCGPTHVKGHKSLLGHAAGGFMDLGVSDLGEFYGEWRHKMSCW